MTYGASYSYRQAGKTHRIDYARELYELRRFAHLLDEAIRIPVIGYRIGLEPILGLIPVIGDLSGLALSSYIIFRAARLGLPRRLVARMIFNAVLNTVVGSIPIIGDLFDFFWKVNKRNMRLIERHLGARV